MATKKISQLTELAAVSLETGGMVEVAMGGENYQLDLKSLFGDYAFEESNLLLSSKGVINITETDMEVGTDFLTLSIESSCVFKPKAEPTATEGMVYFDNSTKKLRCYDGNQWNDLF